MDKEKIIAMGRTYVDGSDAGILFFANALLNENRKQGADARPVANGLTVWYGSMPESNGKSNWTAILHRGDISEGFTIGRSEYPDRVRYEADRVRWLIGETEKEPWILDYDADKRSVYATRDAAPSDASAVDDMRMLIQRLAHSLRRAG